MEDALQQFIDALHAAGMPPANTKEIIADDKWRSFTVQGDRKAAGRYRLGINPDGFGFGNYVYHKDGETHTFNSKTDKKLSPAERKARKEEIAKLQAQREKEQLAEFAKVAAECRQVWDAAKQDDNHPYLKKKGITGTGTRVGSYIDNEGKRQDNVLFVPMYKDGKLTGLQRIWPNGFKAFWEGADCSGAYTAFVDAADDKNTIIICEGFATAASVRAAFPDWPVIIAFNTGNLMPVAQVMRKKYPAARIILAADNDQWTFDRKKHPVDSAGEKIDKEKYTGDAPEWDAWRAEQRMWNPGIDKAMQVGVKIGAHVIWPDIAPNDAGKNTDFNDMEHLHGLDAVRDRILVAAPANRQQDSTGGADDSPVAAGAPFDLEPPEWLEHAPYLDAEIMSRLYGVPEEYYPDHAPAHEGELNLAAPDNDPEDWRAAWRQDLFCNEDGATKPNSLRNAEIFITQHKRYKGMFCFDEFAQEKVVTRCPPWEEEKTFTPRALRDEDKTSLAIDLEPRGICVSIANLSKVLDACVVKNRQNPAREYFKKLKWDGVPRLNTWLRTYCGCIHDDSEYLAAVGRKWLTAAVNRVMRPGCKFDHILIFEGSQDLGKSMMLRELATIHGRAYFDDSIKAKDLPNPNIVPKLQGCLIIELAEMSGFKKMSAEEAKQIISTQEDRIVRKYANEPTRLPRQFVFAGTMNPYAGYLDDPTGDRRYWPVMCTKIDMAALKRDKEQLWAEATHYYREKEPLWLDDEIIKTKAKAAQANRHDIHPWLADLEKLTEQNSAVTPADIWDALVITDRTRRTKDAQDTISKIMTQLGWQYKRRMHMGARRYVWVQGEQSDLLDQLPQTGSNEDEEELTW